MHLCFYHSCYMLHPLCHHLFYCRNTWLWTQVIKCHITHWLGGWVGDRTSLYVWRRVKSLVTTNSWTTNPRSLACGTVTASTEVPQPHGRQLKNVIKWTSKQSVIMFKRLEQLNMFVCVLGFVKCERRVPCSCQFHFPHDPGEKVGSSTHLHTDFPAEHFVYHR